MVDIIESGRVNRILSSLFVTRVNETKYISEWNLIEEYEIRPGTRSKLQVNIFRNESSIYKALQRTNKSNYLNSQPYKMVQTQERKKMDELSFESLFSKSIL